MPAASFGKVISRVKKKNIDMGGQKQENWGYQGWSKVSGSSRIPLEQDLGVAIYMHRDT